MKIVYGKDGGFVGRLYITKKEAKALEEYCNLIGDKEFDVYVIKNWDSVSLKEFEYFIPLYEHETELAEEFINLMKEENESEKL